jgi:ribonucleotide reductase alpha subunit
MSTQQELEYQRKLREEIEETLLLQRSFTDEALRSARAVLGTSENATRTSQAFRQVSNLTTRIANEMKDVVQGTRNLETLQRTQQKRLEAINKLSTEFNLTANQIFNTNQSIANLLTEQVSTQEKQQRIYDVLNDQTLTLSNEERTLLDLYANQYETLAKQEEEMKKIQHQAEEMKKVTGGMFGIAEGADGILKKLGGNKFSEALGLNDAIGKSKEYAQSLLDANGGIAQAGDKFKVMGNLVGNLGKNLFKALSPLAAITMFVQALGQADKETTELQKSMALTKTEAVGFRMGLTEAANQSGNINITATKLLKSFGDLNKQFGFITNFATGTLVTMTKLTEVVGVSSESAGNLAAASEVTGTSFESNYKDALATSYQLQMQSGVQMDLRDILEQTGKVTGTVRANLGANPSLIAKAVTQAKLFGSSLDDVAKAGKSLLDFESSITAELEAELLLGKDINLERARAAALAGDQVTLAQELQKEAGNFSDFTKMNVIQQEALAKAMGMTSDQLADILFQQEVQGKSAKELRALGKDELADRLEAQDLQTKFNATVEKLKAIFVDVASALTPILSVLGDVFSIVGKIIEFLSPLIGTITGIATGFAVGGPVGAIIGGALGAAGDISKYVSTADDMAIPAGYGDTIIKKGKDTIALNNNDTVVAGTNLGQGSQETKRTNQLLERLINQPAVFKIGTDEFFTSTSKYSYQIQ